MTRYIYNKERVTIFPYGTMHQIINDPFIIAFFQVTNVSSRSDNHPEVSENRYYGYLEDIIECDFNSFKIVLFEVKWYMIRINECDTEGIIIEHSNVFTVVNARELELGT